MSQKQAFQDLHDEICNKIAFGAVLCGERIASAVASTRFLKVTGLKNGP